MSWDSHEKHNNPEDETRLTHFPPYRKSRVFYAPAATPTSPPPNLFRIRST